MIGGALSHGEQLLVLTQLDQLFTLDLRLMYPVCILHHSARIQALYIPSKRIFFNPIECILLYNLLNLQVDT